MSEEIWAGRAFEKREQLEERNQENIFEFYFPNL
jgi:hypothetical protein